MTDASTLVPTWGYRPDGSAQIFELEPGAALPDGWHASPDCITDRSLATAEALTEAAERFARARPAPAPTASTILDPQAAAMAEESARLRAENAGLIADLAAVRERLAAAENETAQALERVADMSADLDSARAAALAAPRSDVGVAPEPPLRAEEQPGEPVQPGQPTRTREAAREAVRALLGDGLTDREIARRVGVSPSTVASIRKSLP